MGDVRYALRQLRRGARLGAGSGVLIAAGVGANTLIFTVVDALLLRPLPVRNPQNLIGLFEIRPNLPPQPLIRHQLYRQLAAHSQTLFDVIGQVEVTASLE